jgi:hypothetical protein
MERKKMYFCGVKLKYKIMTVVSTKEFNTHQDKYFDMAQGGDVCIKRGNSLFHLLYQPVEMQYPVQPILEPDDDLRNAITMDELRKSAHEHIHKLFANR